MTDEQLAVLLDAYRSAIADALYEAKTGNSGKAIGIIKGIERMLSRNIDTLLRK